MRLLINLYVHIGFQPHVQNSWDVFIEGKNNLNIKLVDNEVLLEYI